MIHYPANHELVALQQRLAWLPDLILELLNPISSLLVLQTPLNTSRGLRPGRRDRRAAEPQADRGQQQRWLEDQNDSPSPDRLCISIFMPDPARCHRVSRKLIKRLRQQTIRKYQSIRMVDVRQSGSFGGHAFGPHWRSAMNILQGMDFQPLLLQGGYRFHCGTGAG